MKAKVQYNDFTGTVAADISDSYKNSVQEFLSKRFEGYDSKRYFCEGCRIYVSGQVMEPPISIDFVCYDYVDNKYVYLTPKEKMDYQEVFSLFKRLEIVMGGRRIDDIEVKDEDWLEL